MNPCLFATLTPVSSPVDLRSARPNNKVCNSYYQITLSEMVKNYFNREKIGKEFIYEYSDSKEKLSENALKEKRIINFVHKHISNCKLIYDIMDFVFKRKKWII